MLAASPKMPAKELRPRAWASTGVVFGAVWHFFLLDHLSKGSSLAGAPLAALEHVQVSADIADHGSTRRQRKAARRRCSRRGRLGRPGRAIRESQRRARARTRAPTRARARHALLARRSRAIRHGYWHRLIVSRLLANLATPGVRTVRGLRRRAFIRRCARRAGKWRCFFRGRCMTRRAARRWRSDSGR